MRSWPRISAAAADHGAALKDKDNSGLISPPAKPKKECCLEIWRVRGLGSRTREHPSGETDPVYNRVANLYTFFFLSLPLSLSKCVFVLNRTANKILFPFFSLSSFSFYPIDNLHFGRTSTHSLSLWKRGQERMSPPSPIRTGDQSLYLLLALH